MVRDARRFNAGRFSERDMFSNKFFKVCYYAGLEVIGNSINVFFKNNPELIDELKLLYHEHMTKKDMLDMVSHMATYALGDDGDIIKSVDDNGLVLLSNYCLNILYPQARPFQIDGGVLRKNARAQGYICPYCLKPLPLSLEGVSNAHAIAQDSVGNRLDNESLFAAHKCCNENAGLRPTVAHYKVLGVI